MVAGPKYPVPLVSPDGARTDEALASWNLIRALYVAGPKYDVSWPFEPDPEDDTVNPWALRNTCKFFTSAPVMPNLRVLVNEDDTLTAAGAFNGIYDAPLPVEAGCTEPLQPETGYADIYEAKDALVIGP